MSYKFSIRDIRSLKITYIIGSVLGMVPTYSFEKSAISHPIRDRIQAVLMAILFVAAVLNNFLSQMDDFNDTLATYQVTLWMSHGFLASSNCAMVFGSNFRNRREWSKLIGSFRKIDRLLKNVNHRTESFFGNALVQSILWNSAFFSYNIYLVYSLTVQIGVSNLRISLIKVVSSYCGFYLPMLAYNLTAAFACRFRDLNRTIESNFLPKFKNFAVSKQPSKEIEYMLGTLEEMVTSFNRIFGWSLGLAIARTTVGLLMNFSFVVYAFKESDGFEVFIDLYVSALALVPIFLVTMACDAAMKERERTTLLCWKLQTFFPETSGERSALEWLARYARSTWVPFTAADFFEINRRTLLGIFGTSTTYLIVLLQFNANSSAMQPETNHNHSIHNVANSSVEAT